MTTLQSFSTLALSGLISLMSVHQLEAQAPCRSKNQVGMVVCMVADGVSRVANSAGDVRALANVFADHKKRGPRAVVRQDVEQMKSMRIVRAIVEGQSHFRWIVAVRERPAVKLRGRRHGSVSGIARRNCGGDDGGEREEHEGRGATTEDNTKKIARIAKIARSDD